MGGRMKRWKETQLLLILLSHRINTSLMPTYHWALFMVATKSLMWLNETELDFDYWYPTVS